MNGLSIKESVNNVNIEYIWEAHSEDVTVVQSVGYNSQSEVIEFVELPQNVYKAFCILSENM